VARNVAFGHSPADVATGPERLLYSPWQASTRQPIFAAKQQFEFE
jgi:hypothetical protein